MIKIILFLMVVIIRYFKMLKKIDIIRWNKNNSLKLTKLEIISDNNRSFMDV